MLERPCTKQNYEKLKNDTEFTCYGALTYRKQTTFNFTCYVTEDVEYQGNDHDCICSRPGDFNIQPCEDRANSVAARCSSDKECTITWNSEPPYDIPSHCTKVLVENRCKVKCRIKNEGDWFCQKTITCQGLSGSNEEGCKNPSSIATNDVPKISSTTSPTSTTLAAPDQSRQTTPHTDGNSVSIALGVVAGLAILALIVTLVLVFIFRRRQRGRKTPSTEVYVHMNTSDVGSITYESCSNAKDRQSEMYMDIDEAAILKSDPTSQPQSGTVSAPDSVCNTIDDGYAQTDAKVHRSQDQAGPDDVAFTSASYFVLEKPNERITGSSQRPTTDLNTSENYFVLDKDDTPVLSDIEGQDNDRVIVQPSNADNYFVLEEQANEENNENAQPGNYFLLEEENKINTKEGNPTDDAYNTLNSDINNDKNEPVDDYSHARGVASSQENTTRETNLKEDSEDYDKLFQNQNNKIVYDSDNDYDHMNTADL